MEVWVLIGWIAFSVAVGMAAGKRGRGAASWFFISILCSPLLAFIFLFVSSDLSVAPGPSAKTHKKCPSCAEMILKEAKVCRYCQRDQPEKSISPVQVPMDARYADIPDDQLGESQLMDKYGIGYDGKNYLFKEYKYENISDAVAYVSRSTA